MALLFVGGVMNSSWIAGLTLIVLVEKLALGEAGRRRMTGALLVSGGLVLLA